MKLLVRNSDAVIQAAEDGPSRGPSLLEETKELAFPFGEVRLMTKAFQGIRIVLAEWTYREKIELELQSNAEEIFLVFNLKGRFSLEHRGAGRTLEFLPLQHNLIYSKMPGLIFRNEDLFSTALLIALRPEAYERLAGESCERLLKFGGEMKRGEAASLSGTNGWMDLSMQTAIDAMIRCAYRDDLKKMFLLSKCMELLVLQSASFDRQEGRKFLYCKTDYDRERILFARDYLLQHYDVPPTLPALARIAGINEFKLKKGFKELFNATVFGYLNDYKMELAKNELQLGQKTASQLAFDLGYSSLQHFSNAFRKKFGRPPSAFARP